MLSAEVLQSPREIPEEVYNFKPLYQLKSQTFFNIYDLLINSGYYFYEFLYFYLVLVFSWLYNWV